MKSKFLMFFLTLVLALGFIGVNQKAYGSGTWDGTYLDYGIYWFGYDGVSKKASGPSNPYFNPAKPTVIFVHGWQPGFTQDLFRYNFNWKYQLPAYGLDVDEAKAWIDDGWNIGIFYWNQFADEDRVGDAEDKIWTSDGLYGMRWRTVDGNYHYDGPNRSAAELFADAYKEAMTNYNGKNIRIAGHSQGNQMAVRMTKLIHEQIKAGELPAHLLPKRVALLDPYWSALPKTYLGGRQTGSVILDYVKELKESGVSFEQYRTSSLDAAGDLNLAMRQQTAFTEVLPEYILANDQADRHNVAIDLFLLICL